MQQTPRLKTQLYGESRPTETRGLPTLIWEAYAKARDRCRDELLMYREMKTMVADQKIYMTTKYNLAYDGLRTQVLKTWDLLDHSSSTWQIHSLGLQVGYCRPKCLQNLLVRSKLPSNIETMPHAKETLPKCTNPHCRYCPILNTDGHIKASLTGSKYRK